MSSVLMCLSVFVIIRMIKLKKSGVYVGMGVREHQAAVCGGFIGPLLWRSQTNALMPSLLYAKCLRVYQDYENYPSLW
jgi:hypothetical protein